MDGLMCESTDSIPDLHNMDENTMYISLKYNTVIHKCLCGCGNEVVTPLSPSDCKLSYNGESISLSPSIGSWEIKCKSHYFITRSEVRWAETWSDKKIRKARKKRRKKFIIF